MKGRFKDGISIYRRSEREEGVFPMCKTKVITLLMSKTIARRWRIQERKDKVRPEGHSKNVVFDPNLVSH